MKRWKSNEIINGWECNDAKFYNILTTPTTLNLSTYTLFHLSFSSKTFLSKTSIQIKLVFMNHDLSFCPEMGNEEEVEVVQKE